MNDIPPPAQNSLAARVRKAEEMLLGYLKDRKKAAAQLALETLAGVAPQHPRLDEYRTWVLDLDREVERLQRLAQELAAGRSALLAGDLAAARRHLETLRKLDSDADATLQLAAEIRRVEADEAESADVEEIKKRFDDHVAAHRFADAEADLQTLATHDVPKVTLDRLRRRLDDMRHSHDEEEEFAAIERRFAEHMARREWQQARELAHQAGQRFRHLARPAEMFNEVQRREADERNRESIRQGIATLEQLIARGQKDQAALALRLLRGKIDAGKYAELERRMAAL